MGQIFTGLVLAAVTSLAFIAYHHPKEYKVLSVILSGIAIIIFAGIAIWNTAVNRSQAALDNVPYPDEPFVTSNTDGKEGSELPSVNQRNDFVYQARNEVEKVEFYPDAASGVVIVILGFLWALTALPLLGIVDKKTDTAPKKLEENKPEEVPPE